jgi:MraZ protein
VEKSGVHPPGRALWAAPKKIAMLIGEHTHTIDPKKRIAIPAKFRKEIGEKVVVTHGLDNCLFIYPIVQWNAIAEKLANLPIGQADTRGFNRFMLAGAVETDVDSLGRILIPDFLKQFAGLKERVVMAGVHTRIEVWDEDTWKTYKEKVQGQAESMAEKLGEIGMF